MIDRVRGRCLHKSPAEAVLEVGGVALAIAVPLGTSEKLSEVGSEVMLITHLHVREDMLQLYGFLTTGERDLFAQLIKVSGVGPKLALAILSRYSPDDLIQVVSSGDSRRLTAVRGIGRKTAERLMLELKDRLSIPSYITTLRVAGEVSVEAEAIQALEALGFTIFQADEAVRHARARLDDDATVEELVRQALKG